MIILFELYAFGLLNPSSMINGNDNGLAINTFIARIIRYRLMVASAIG